MSDLFRSKDNEFIAWYPNRLDGRTAEAVWQPRRAGYYVHIPFCTAICDYCGFAIEQMKAANVSRYMDALRREIARYAELHRLAGQRFVCGHFGGGTPSAVDAEALVAIKRQIDASFDVASDAEITVEVNPISFTLDKAQTRTPRQIQGAVRRAEVPRGDTAGLRAHVPVRLSIERSQARLRSRQPRVRRRDQPG